MVLEFFFANSVPYSGATVTAWGRIIATLPVPEVVKDMAAHIEGISNHLDLQGKQMEQIQSQMLTAEHFKVLEGKSSSIQAGFKAMQTEIRALLTALERK